MSGGFFTIDLESIVSASDARSPVGLVATVFNASARGRRGSGCPRSSSAAMLLMAPTGAVELRLSGLLGRWTDRPPPLRQGAATASFFSCCS